jgi:hypothetical protein
LYLVSFIGFTHGLPFVKKSNIFDEHLQQTHHTTRELIARSRQLTGKHGPYASMLHFL